MQGGNSSFFFLFFFFLDNKEVILATIDGTVHVNGSYMYHYPLGKFTLTTFIVKLQTSIMLTFLCGQLGTALIAVETDYRG